MLTSAGLSAQTYCSPSYSTGCTFGDYIDDFTVGTFSDLSTGCSSSGYDNSTSDTIEVSVGAPTALSLTAGYSNQSFGIFADFNSDGDFSDAGEFLWANATPSGAAFTATSGSLLIPSTYTLGNYRMRVVMIWNNGGAISATQSCPSATYGETHDYTLKLTPPPACPAPAYLSLVSASDTSATLSWSSADTVFNVDYGPGGFSLATGAYTTVTANDTTITITGLTPATYYDFYITTNCTASSNGLSTISGPITVLTNCVPFTSPFSENFENDSTGDANAPNAPICWYYTEDAGAGGYGFVSDLSGGSYAGSNFYLLVNNSGADREYLVSPEISDLDSADLQVEFWAKNPSTWNPSVEFIVGTMTVPTNPATFHAVDTIQITTTNTWEKYTVYLDTNYGYNGTDLHLAFGTSSSTAFTTVYFDNIEISDAPTCLPAANFAVVSTSQDSAQVSFQASASTVYIEYGPVGFLQGTGPIDTVTTGSPHWITGLNAGSTYEAYLWQDCNANGLSPKIGPITFSTSACSAADMCEYTIVLTDSWGDGWNGGEVELSSNALGVLGTYGATFTSGDYDTISVMLCSGYPLALKVTDAGSYPSEMGIEVYKNGSLLDSYSASTSTSVGTTMANFTTINSGRNS